MCIPLFLPKDVARGPLNAFASDKKQIIRTIVAYMINLATSMLVTDFGIFSKANLGISNILEALVPIVIRLVCVHLDLTPSLIF